MNEKILLQILLPANQLTYEFRVPCCITVRDGAVIVSRMLATYEQACYSATDSCHLMFLEGARAGELLDPNTTFGHLVGKELLLPGTRLALV